MATQKIRVSGYVDADLAALIASTAVELGVSSSHLVADLLESSAPVMQVLGDTARTLREAPQKQRQALAGLADAMRPLLQAAEAQHRDLEALTIGPPPSNTGVRK